MRSAFALVIAVAFTSGTAFAQTTPQNPAVKDPTVKTAPPGGATTGRGTGTEGAGVMAPLSALEAGANSFTEAQARSRLESAGFSNVSDLAKDAQGVWRGKAMRDGRSVTVGLDYKGTIGSQ